MRFAVIVFGGVAAAVLLAVVAGVVFWSGASVVGDPIALARVEVQPLGGTLASVQAFGPARRRIALTRAGGRLTPRDRLSSGERVTVEVVVRRPGWLAWALGRERHLRLSLQTPVARVPDRWLTVRSAARVRIRFDQPVSSVVFWPSAHSPRVVSGRGRDVVPLALGARQDTGSFKVAAAARSWERPGPLDTVNWFPPARLPVVVARPAARAEISPVEPIHLTFSRPVAEVFGSARPTFVPHLSGRWTESDSHTLTFAPEGLGAGLGTDLRMRLPQPVAQATGRGVVQSLRTLGWSVPPGSLLRLQQLLAEQGYLPLKWIPAGANVTRTLRAELNAAVKPPPGRFAWQYANTPPELQQLWSPGQSNEITRGAVMTFENEHGLTVDALAGPRVWHALLNDAVSDKHHAGGYSYVFVHRNIPQLLTLWHDGHIVLTSPGNTGVPSAPTQLGTWPVFEHLPVGTMSGTNPDGSHYNDPGIRWISYFHGGDALHAFPRASFGTPQSLGCVELPLDAAARVWPYTPIGTLVTIEN